MFPMTEVEHTGFLLVDKLQWGKGTNKIKYKFTLPIKCTVLSLQSTSDFPYSAENSAQDFTEVASQSGTYVWVVASRLRAVYYLCIGKV